MLKLDMDKDISIKIAEFKDLLRDLDQAIASTAALLKKEAAEDPKDAQDLNLTQITVGSNVEWDSFKGTVVQLYKRFISKTLNSETEASLEGSPEDPALLIKDAEGKEYLKPASQVKLLLE